MPRRFDLYSVEDLNRPSVGEFKSVKDIVNFYNKVGAVQKVSTKPQVQSVKAMYSLPKAKKQDVDMIEILNTCFEEHGIEHNWRYQKSGTCVGQAGATASEIVMAVAWLVMDKKFPGRAAVATGYAGSRVEVGKNPGRWDGSRGEWIAGFLSGWGVALLSEIGLEDDELDADERLGVQWAASRQGVPEKFEVIAKERPIVSAPLITDEDELIACMESGNPVIDCSNLIPLDRKTDNTVPVQRSGGHATVFGGIRWSNGLPQIKYVNSWSLNWGNQGCVWITMKDAMKIIAQDDSYALVGIHGLEPGVKL